MGYLLTLNQYPSAPVDACHLKVTEVPDIVAPSAGEDKVGAESIEGVEEVGVGVGVGVVSPPNRPQANPETSNIPKRNTVVILVIFTIYLQLFREISS